MTRKTVVAQEPAQQRTAPASFGLTDASVAPLRPRRSPRLLIAGILAICLGALAAATLYTQSTHAVAVLRLTHTVPRGTVLTAADLGSVSLPPTPGVSTVRASDMQRVIGREALVDLPSGALLTPESYGASVVAEGTVHVGLKLGPGRAPVRPVPVGAAVVLVSVPPSGQAGGSAVPEVSYRATVVTAPSVQVDGAQILDVAVAAADAQRIAKLAAADALVLVREGDR